MGHKLTGDQRKVATRKLAELQRQIGQDEYPHDPEKLLGALQAINDGRFEVVGTSFPSQIYALELIPENWEVVEDVVPTTKSGREFVTFIEAWEEYIGGGLMRARGKKLGANLGLVDAKYDLEHQENSSVELRGKYLVYSGTVLRDSVGRLNVPDLGWRGGRWVLGFRWISGLFYGSGRLARSK